MGQLDDLSYFNCLPSHSIWWKAADACKAAARFLFCDVQAGAAHSKSWDGVVSSAHYTAWSHLLILLRGRARQRIYWIEGTFLGKAGDGKSCSIRFKPLCKPSALWNRCVKNFTAKWCRASCEKILISRTSYIDLPEVPFGMEVVDKKKAEDWFDKQRKNTAPTKHQQFKATKALLAYGESDSKRRQEWLD